MESRVYLICGNFDGSIVQELLIGENAVKEFMVNGIFEDAVKKEEIEEIKRFIKEQVIHVQTIGNDIYHEYLDTTCSVTITYLGDKPAKIIMDAFIKANPPKSNKKK